MAIKSSIEWTEATWNPSTGCDAISPGCENCYAERMSHRLKAMGQNKYRNGFKLTTHPKTLELPLTWKKPQRIFVNSMSDLFHDQVPLEYIQQVFSTMRRAHWHEFQVLTKRSGRVLAVNEQIDWPPNVWMGVSVESAAFKSRIDHLRKTDARVKFLSLEPLIGDLGSLELAKIDWVIVGGESGPGARPMKSLWVDGIRQQCGAASVPFFFKQWGGVQKKQAGRNLNGRTYDEMPVAQTPLVQLQV
uniref:Phage Gp37Gp68 family protein n=1 Tax=Solibacter usitatus (strain Ellin6076) TaxID=234267 RepID=Q01S54_SOLUE